MGATCSKQMDAATMPVDQFVDTSTSSEFLPFSNLNDDVILCIMSFVSYAPFENDASGTMTLSAIEDPNDAAERRPSRRHPADDAEIQKLIEDYNKGASRLRKGRMPRAVFRATRQYYRVALNRSKVASSEQSGKVRSCRTFGTLTHVLPLVNKRFHLLCTQSPVLWTDSLERLMGLKSSHMRSDIGSGDLWEEGMVSFIASRNSDSDDDRHTPVTDSADGSNDVSFDSEYDRIRSMIAKARDCVNGTEVAQSSNTAYEVLKQVSLHYKPTRLPVFSMYCPALIGEEIDLRLFEPRYRLLITEIMVGRSEREKSGVPLSSPRPRFVFACRIDAWRRKVACIVEVRRCLIRRDGMADITIVPIAWTIMKSLSTRPESGGLVDATLLRTPERKRLPAFCMRTHMVLEEPIRLRLYEDRYKTMIAEVMAGTSDDERNGSPVSDPRPQFVFVCNNRFKEGDVACLVEVERCRIHSDGSAQVTVVPTAWVLIEALKVRPKSGKLYEASILYLLPPLAHQNSSL